MAPTSRPPRLKGAASLGSLEDLLQSLIHHRRRELAAPQGATLTPDLVWIVEPRRDGKLGKPRVFINSNIDSNKEDILIAVGSPSRIQRGGGAGKSVYKSLYRELVDKLDDRWACPRNLFAAISGSHVLPAILKGYDIAFIPAYVDEDGKIVLEEWVRNECDNYDGGLQSCKSALCRQYRIALEVWRVKPPAGARDPLEYINIMGKLTAQDQARYYVAYVESQTLKAPLRAVVVAGGRAPRSVRFDLGECGLDGRAGEDLPRAVDIRLPPDLRLGGVADLSGVILRHTLHYIASSDPVEAFYYLGLLLSRWMVSELEELVHQTGKQTHLTGKPAAVIERAGAIYSNEKWQRLVATCAAGIQYRLASYAGQVNARRAPKLFRANRIVSRLYDALNNLVNDNLG